VRAMVLGLVLIFTVPGWRAQRAERAGVAGR